MHATAIKESAVTLAGGAEEGRFVCSWFSQPSSGQVQKGAARGDYWCKAGQKPILKIKRRGRSRGKQAERGKRVSKGRAASEEEAICRGSTERELSGIKAGTQSTEGAQPGEP